MMSIGKREQIYFSVLNVRFWPILLKKSAVVSTAEKYALEIEIFTLSRREDYGLRFGVAA
jgi:hypothetical protein